MLHLSNISKQCNNLHKFSSYNGSYFCLCDKFYSPIFAKNRYMIKFEYFRFIFAPICMNLLSEIYFPFKNSRVGPYCAFVVYQWLCSQHSIEASREILKNWALHNIYVPLSISSPNGKYTSKPFLGLSTTHSSIRPMDISCGAYTFMTPEWFNWFSSCYSINFSRYLLPTSFYNMYVFSYLV